MWEPKKDVYYELRPERVPKYRIQFEAAKQLSDVPGYSWFTPAAMYLWGKFSDVQLADVVRQLDVKLFWYLFDKPVFSGFTYAGDKSWNHALWAVESSSWDKFVDRILEIVLVDKPQRAVYRFALQRLIVADPLYVDTAVVLSRIPPAIVIWSFAVLTNSHQIAFTKLDYEPGVIPAVRTLRPLSESKKIAAELYKSGSVSTDQLFESYKKRMLLEDEQNYQAGVRRMRGEGKL